MDSNFQVTIQASVEGLRKSIKEAQGVLGQFEVSADKAAAATKGIEREANRGRLAAFAFGQVIRDAGFFSQSFGLGLLAISNNIPILIDQLTLLAGLSGAAGSAISLLGSLLTAGLTIWAYSASAVDKNKQSIDEYINTLDDLTQTKLTAANESKGELIDLENLRKAAQDQTLSLKERLNAVKALKETWPSYYQNLSDEAIMAGNDAQAHRNLANAIISVAKAQANKDKIVQNSKKIDVKYQQIQDSKLAQEKFVSDAILEVREELVDKGIKTDSAYFKNYIAQSKSRLRSTEKYNEFTKEQNRLEAERGELMYSNLQLADQTLSLVKSTGTIAITGDFGKKGKAEKPKVDPEVIKNQELFNATLEQYWKITDDLSGRRLDIYSAVDTKKSQQIKQDIESTSDALNKYLRLSSESPDLNAFLEMQVTIDALKKKLEELGVTFQNALNTEKATDSLKRFNENISNILQSGVIDLFSSSFMAIGDAISRGGNIADAAAAALLGSIANIAQQLGELAIGVGIGIEAIKASLKSFGGIGAILAGVALLALAGYARNRASVISSSGGGKGSSSNPSGGSFGGVRPFASGGIISGDTLGLMGEYPNARSNPEVVAPLDKLTSLISGSLGDIGGNMGGQLTARISGNDLVILLDRASKNRKNYF
jgi:hypothetical protein